MSTPTYILLLNSIILGEYGGHQLYNVWADHTSDEGLQTASASSRFARVSMRWHSPRGCANWVSR
jgi:hypothetical protein